MVASKLVFDRRISRAVVWYQWPGATDPDACFGSTLCSGLLSHVVLRHFSMDRFHREVEAPSEHSYPRIGKCIVRRILVGRVVISAPC